MRSHFFNTFYLFLYIPVPIIGLSRFNPFMWMCKSQNFYISILLHYFHLLRCLCDILLCFAILYFIVRCLCCFSFLLLHFVQLTYEFVAWMYMPLAGFNHTTILFCFVFLLFILLFLHCTSIPIRSEIYGGER